MNDFPNFVNTNRSNLPINLSLSFRYDRKRRLTSFLLRVINFGKNDFGILRKDVYRKEREKKFKNR